MITTVLTIVLVLVLSITAQHSQSYTTSPRPQFLDNKLPTDYQNDTVTNKLHIGPDLPLFRVPNSVVDVPIPINIPFYEGNDNYTTDCNRNEIGADYGNTCKKLLIKGSCKIDEEVVIDPITGMGSCVPRLCPPDRIFVVATQLCHDPRDTNVCPGKRELRYTAYGTAICDCPVGTIVKSKSTNMYDDACQPIYGDTNSCPNGQVFSLDSQGSPKCLPDPCLKFNMHRKPNTLQYVADQKTGHCHQLGSTSGICPEGTVYALHLPTLKGVCEIIENLGFDIFSPEDVENLKNLYGPTSIWDNVVSSAVGYKVPSTSTTENNMQFASVTSPALSTPIRKYRPYPSLNQVSGSRSPISTQSMSNFMVGLENELLHSLGLRYQTAKGILKLKDAVPLSGNGLNQIYSNSREPRSVGNIANHHLPTKFQFLRRANGGLLTIAEDIVTTPGKIIYRRFKRQGTSLFAASSNIFETKLLSCSAGARRDFNNKCQDTILPVRTARSLDSKPFPPIPPRPMCPMGLKYNIKRMCTSDPSFLSKNVVGGLG